MRKISPLAARMMFGGRRLVNLRSKSSLMKKRPNLLKQAAHLAEAVVKHITDDMREVSNDQLQVRLKICNNCEEYRDGDTCTHPECGCSLVRKALWHSEDCPIGKWPKL